MKNDITPANTAKNANTPNKKPADKKSAEKKTVNKVVNIVVNVLLIATIIFAVICTYVSFVTTSGDGVPSIFGLRLMSIQTNSMYPEFEHGDLIISTKVKPEDLRPGDVITFWTTIQGSKQLNTHRIVTIYDGGEALIFETKGDAVDTVDPLTVHERYLVGKYQFKIKGLGKVFDYLQTDTGFLLVVVLPVFIFFIYHLVQFFRVLFEYQNVKNRIKYEQERGRTEDLIAIQKAEAAKRDADRAAMEAELREKLRKEILESMQDEKNKKE